VASPARTAPRQILAIILVLLPGVTCWVFR
jgi:hypothetical protein